MYLTDIVYLVADLLDENDRAHLAQVSRLYFELVMPLAWRTVIGVTQLFKLIPDVRVDTPGILAGTETINIPKNLDSADIVRFQFYARFVKHLQLFKNPAVVTKLNRWDELLQYTNHNTLLPSLRSISLGTYWPQSISHYAWIAAFSSPSIQILETHPLVRQTLPTISTETALGIFKLLVDRCPNLESLSIFINPQQRTSRLEPRLLGGGGVHQQGRGELLFEAVKHVRNLTCTSSMADSFQDTFLLLSRLPNLESLRMYASQQYGDHTIPTIPLEPDAFSQLTSLTLYDFGPYATLSIFDHLSSAAELSQLALELNHKAEEVSSLDEFYNLELIPTICARTRRLQRLIIRPIIEDKAYIHIQQSSLQLLSALPLNHLTLAKSHADIEQLTELFPRIQILRLPDLPVTISQLCRFTACRELEHLSLKLDLSPRGPTEPSSDRFSPTAPLFVLETDYGGFDRLSQTDTRDLLSYLSGMWSESMVIQQIVPFDYPHHDLAAKKRLRNLNRELEEIRKLDKEMGCRDSMAPITASSTQINPPVIFS
ncbi:hypothetical protein RHS04_06307 [Rhizoctonia solani]|uniref:F-box domain-containing protein n=1 Tax=Rhizoctonia solani TaxID=456999 RepID=A0A8H7H631_9AGAM|nr:hypothetical protein RHS04_06307 [Rhizoctonia solani]